MITYEIISKNTSTLPRRNQKKPGQTGYEEEMFQRALLACKLKEGDYVQVKGTPRRGFVQEIATKFEDVQWDRKRPMFLKVLSDGKLFAAHPSQLKRRTAP